MSEMNSAKNFMKWKPVSAKEQESQSFVQGLQEKNLKLARDLQKEKLANGQLTGRFILLTQHLHNSEAEINRFKQSFNRVSVFMEEFVPALLKCSDLVNKIVEEIETVNAQGNQSVHRSQRGSSNRPTVEALEELSVKSPESSTLQRTGIAKPIVQGHTIFKPSVSLQRFHHAALARMTPAPIRGLQVSDILTSVDTSVTEGLSVIVEEEDDQRAASPLVPVDALTGETEPITNSVRTVRESGSRPTGASVETGSRPTGASVETGSTASDENMEEVLESSDDEAIELSLIESRRQLTNCGRRKELKEGTSQDYDDLGHYTPGGSFKRKRRKRRAKDAKVPGSPGGTVNNGITAARRSVDNLLTSFDRTPIGSEITLKPDPGAVGRTKSDVESSGRNSGSPSRSSLPRVCLADVSPRNHRTKTENVRNGGSTTDETSEEIFPLLRQGLITTRKRSARAAGSSNVSSDEEQSDVAAHRRSRKISKHSWTALNRRRSGSLEEGDQAQMEVANEAQATPSKSSSFEGEKKTSPFALPGELPTVLLQRCSGSFTGENLLRNKTSTNSNEGAEPVSLNVPELRNSEELRRSGSQGRSKPKSRSRPKARSKPKKLSNKKSSESRKSNGSRNEDSGAKSSLTSVTESRNNSTTSNCDIEGESTIAVRGDGRPRRVTAPMNLKEKPLNVKLRREEQLI